MSVCHELENFCHEHENSQPLFRQNRERAQTQGVNGVEFNRKSWSRQITTGAHNPMDQAELEANTCSRRQARENAWQQVTIGFGFTSDWLIKCHVIFSQSQSVNCKAETIAKLLSTQLKTTIFLDRLEVILGRTSICCYEESLANFKKQKR